MVAAAGLALSDGRGAEPPDPYAEVWWGGVKLGVTCTVHDAVDPQWGDSFVLDGFDLSLDPATATVLLVRVFDRNGLGKDDFLGQLTLRGQGLEALPELEGMPKKYELSPDESQSASYNQYVQGGVFLTCTQEQDSALATTAAERDATLARITQIKQEQPVRSGCGARVGLGTRYTVIAQINPTRLSLSIRSIFCYVPTCTRLRGHGRARALAEAVPPCV